MTSRIVNMAISHAQANFCRQCGRDLRLPADDAAACTVCRRSPCIDTRYTQFRNQILREMVRSLGVPVSPAQAAAYCVDPVTEARADAVRLVNRTDTYASRTRCMDWKREFEEARRRAEIQSRHRCVVRIFTVCCLVMSIIAIMLGTRATCLAPSRSLVELHEIVEHPPLVVRPGFRSVEWPY